MINKHLTQKGASWPLYAAVSAYAMNTFASTALQGLSPFELVFARKPRQLTSFKILHQGPYHTFLTMRKQFYFPNMLPKIQKYIEACALCQRTKPKNTKQRLYYGRIPIEYVPCKNLAVDLKKMPMGILQYEYLLIATCEKTNFVHTIPLQNRKTQTIADALLHHVCFLTGPLTKLSINQDSALTSQVIKELLTSLECTIQIISPWNHRSSKAE